MYACIRLRSLAASPSLAEAVARRVRASQRLAPGGVHVQVCVQACVQACVCRRACPLTEVLTGLLGAYSTALLVDKPDAKQQ